MVKGLLMAFMAASVATMTIAELATMNMYAVVTGAILTGLGAWCAVRSFAKAVA
jgi:hypothetical protein